MKHRRPTVPYALEDVYLFFSFAIVMIDLILLLLNKKNIKSMPNHIIRRYFEKKQIVSIKIAKFV